MEHTLFAYHVVTERPMYLGQHILFDESHHSGVYERVGSIINVGVRQLNLAPIT